MIKVKKKNIFKQHRDYLKRDQRLFKIMNQLEIDEKSYLDALYQIESNKIIPDKIYTDTAFQQ